MRPWIEQQAHSLNSAYKSTLDCLEAYTLKLAPENASDIRQNFFNAVQIGLVYVAGADGAINGGESKIINIFLNDDNNRWHHDALRKIVLEKPSLVDNLTSMMQAYMAVIAEGIRSDGEAYYSTEDLVLGLFSNMGELLIAADDDVSPKENRALAEIISPLRERARELEETYGQAGMSVAPATVAVTEAAISEPVEANGDPLTKLHGLIGLADVKVEVETLGNLARVFSLRKERGLPVPDMSFHLVFTGNPGTGKTTVARIIADIFGRLGLLSKGHLVEVDRSGLVANYVGQTATKTKDALDRAGGGVLFIDEAYSLSSGGDQDFGREAIETILKAMEDNRDDLVVIVAGYTKEMEDFLKSNPGLLSRFSKTICFPDYSPEEMVEIFRKFSDEAAYKLSDEASNCLLPVMEKRWEGRDSRFANARDVRKMFEHSISDHARRISALSDITEIDLTTFSATDMPSI